jgi:hypothetical protein
MRIRLIKAFCRVLNYEVAPTRLNPPVWIIKDRKIKVSN